MQIKCAKKSNQLKLNSGLFIQEFCSDLTDQKAALVSGGTRPCRDENDTSCYSLVTLECR